MTSRSTPIVVTDKGQVRGIVENEAFVFKGIPYAKPPVGQLRWRAPAEIDRWDDLLEANAYGHSSWQNRQECIDTGGGDPGPSDEDCLYLNVWTPQRDPIETPRLPVLVWIHGGAYVIGAGGLPPYNGSPLVKRGAVVVTFNYRLGRLGFFVHPALEAEAPQGERPIYNFGLLDQIAALQWVQRNIAQFGGDPNNVTIFGQSAGGKSVLALFASPLAQGLFHKGIAQSVYRITDVTPNKARTRGNKVATMLGLGGAAATAADLRDPEKVPAQAIFDIGSDPDAAKGTANSPNPISGDVVLPKPIFDTFLDGQDAPLPLIIGNTSDDASVLEAFGLDLKSVLLLVPVNCRPVKDYYPDDQGLDNDELGRRVARDAIFTVLPYTIANARIGRAPTFRYYFDYTAEGLRPTVTNGTRHGDDIIYVFNTGDMCPPTEGIFTDHDRAFARRVSEYWYNFALSGSPTFAGSPAWLPHGEGHDLTMRFGERIELIANYMKEYMQKLEAIGKSINDTMLLFP
jgi:para-nitrobenzyl esterase